MELELKKIKGKGWEGLTFKLKEEDELDLLDLVNNYPEKYPFFLESSSRGNNQNRNSILFYKPRVLLKKEKNNSINFLNEFDVLWKEKQISQGDMFFKDKKIPFCGGWFVYLGYEIANEIEKKLRIPFSPFVLPDAFAAKTDSAIIYDHIDKRIFLTTDKKDSCEDFDDILNDLSNLKCKKNKAK